MGNFSCRNRSEYPKTLWKCRKRNNTSESDDEEGGNLGKRREIDLDDLIRQLNQVELEQLDDMRKLIELRPHVFLLDNILLSIQLFPNYEEDIKIAQKKLEAREAKLNANLLPEKFVILPDLLSEHFNGKLTFSSQQISDEPFIEPLTPTRMYLVYDNVQVTELDNARFYSSPDELAVDYTFILRKTNRSGCVRLEQKEVTLKGRRFLNTIDSLSTLTFHDQSSADGFSSYESVDDSTNSKSHNNSPKLSTCSMPELRVDEIYGSSSRESSSSIQDFQNTCSDEMNLKMKKQQDTISERNEEMQQWKVISSNSSSSGYTSGSSSTEASDSLLTCSIGSLVDPSVIPENCFVGMKFTNVFGMKEFQNIDQLTSNRQSLHGIRTRLGPIEQNHDLVYVSGREFSRHFARLFKNQLAVKLGFNSRSFCFAKKAGTSIRIESIELDVGINHNRVEQYEVRGCLASSWPSWTRSWLDRAAQAEWPGPELARQVYATDCILLPQSEMSFGPVQPGVMTQERLNWSLGWPMAERLLEASFTPAHATVHVVGLVLLKTYCAQNLSTRSPGLSAQHLANQLFWMIEQQPNWSELRMGTRLMRLLESLRWGIQHRSMPDYFLPERNLLAFGDNDTLSSSTISTTSSSSSSSTSRAATDRLLLAQKQLARLIENPVMYLLHALEKMRYRRPYDFPELDYRDLHRLLTVDELWLYNPKLAEIASNTPDIDEQTNFQQQHQTRQHFWSEAKLASHCQRRMNVKRSCRSVDEPIRVQRTPDFIVDITEKCEPLKGSRLACILVFFSEHLLRVGRRCHELGASRAKSVCLQQVKLLAVLLASEPSNSPETQRENRALAADFLREVRKLDGLVTIPPSMMMGMGLLIPPETPKRNAPDPNFSSFNANVEVHSLRERPSIDEDSANELVTSF